MEESGSLRVSPLVLIACEAALAAGWLLDYAVLEPPFPVAFDGVAPLAPLYAFARPVLRFEAVAFALLALALLRASEALADPARVGKRAFAVALGAGALLLPLALFAVRQDLAELGQAFEIYPTDEFLHDARGIVSAGAFLQHYVERMPELSLHGSHFPPGHALLLYAVGRVFGFGALPAGIAVLVLFAAGALVCWTAFEERWPGKPARQAALLLLACPSFLDFACTSMDGAFLLFAALAWRAGLRALAPEGRAGQAVAAGVLLLVATCFSFSTIPLGLALFLYAALSGSGRPWQTALRLAWIGGAYALSALALFWATGLSLWKCLAAARENGMELMARAAGEDPRALTLQFWFGNPVAFAIGAGVALVPALVARIRERPLFAEPFTPSVLLALAAMSFGGIYFMETERVWLFALPWLALAAVSTGPFDRTSMRLLLAGGLAQALAMEIGLFTLW